MYVCMCVCKRHKNCQWLDYMYLFKFEGWSAYCHTCLGIHHYFSRDIIQMNNNNVTNDYTVNLETVD